MTRPKPVLLVLAGEPLFGSFFDGPRRRRLSRLYRWRRTGARSLTPPVRSLLAEADALLTTWDSPRLDASLPEAAPRLRLVAHCGGEVKGRFARPLFDRLTITNAAGPMAPYVAELAVAFVLHAARNLDGHREALRRPANDVYAQVHARGAGSETVRDRTVGLVGFGRIGQAVAALLRPFGPRLLVHDPYASRTLARRHGVTLAPLRRVLAASPFLILATALTDATRGMLDRSALALLPDGATVINVARGGLVDLRALTREVRRGRLRCALDVTDPLEPLPIRHPLRRARGAVLTPHVGSAQAEVRRQMADVVLDDLGRFARGRPVRNRVTAEMLERMT
jgi:phosphoglycerate dehydrogenase-like enzyme